MCGSCRVTVGGQVRFACVDGPDFDGHQVDFEELLARQPRFARQEAAASEDYAHVCRVTRQLFLEEKRNYKKIKELAPRQTAMPERGAEERTRSFDEVNLGYTLTDALAEAERCIQCVKPTCIAGCPVAIDIPRFIRHLLVRDLDGALDVVRQSNVFPSICGRVCPQESQCEAQCVIGRKVEPVAIGRLERFVGDHGRPSTSAPTPGRLGRVAVVGSGPAGLACAADLARYGAEVTLYEALHVVGGVLRYGIPAFRLPRATIDREVRQLGDMGVRIETNRVIGKTFTVAELRAEKGFDALFLGVGAGAPTFLGIPGESAGQVYSANEFLTRVNLMGGDRFPLAGTPVSLGSSVVVIGAGNTAMDCLRVARRLGVPRVRCVYRRSEAEAPARVEELRHAKEEGIEFLFLHAPVEIRLDGNAVRGMRLQKMTLGEPDERGRRRPVPVDAFVELDCDTVIYALGTRANPIITRSTAGLGLDRRGYIVADDETQATNLPGIFAGGDIVTGGATVILAMGAGRRAARAIAAYLAGDRAWPVSRAAMAAWVPPPRAAAPVPRPGLEPRSAEARCPRCRRRVEEDEPYVCCAAAILAWRCRGCAKVSEGFAFPYGACPACGGTLERIEERGRADGSALEPIRMAFEIELGGLAFYERAAREAGDGELEALFGKFAAMEREHMATLSRRYHVDPPPPAAGFRLEIAALYAGVPHRPEDPLNLFRVAIGFELRAERRFLEEAERSSNGSIEHGLYRELAAEEAEHAALLRTEMQRYEQGKAGLL